MALGFTQEAVEKAKDDWSQIDKLNKALDRLQKRKVPSVAAEGDLGISKVAWKIATFQQAILYRIVMLAAGTADMWNSGNCLGSVLCARALMESGVLVWD